ncbi:MAG: 30S ribosomal protein S6 [Candidatus Carbobacillus sp.]|nr:30S ribosomal protein S6 [Candidatus Carbobacillus sp.]
MRRYEILFILRPDLSDTDVEAHRERIKQVIEGNHGQIEKIENMGKRRLAYEIEKFREGIYTVIYFNSDADTVKELERVVGITEPIIRHLIVRHDEAAS